MPVITVSGKLGSGARDVAQQLAHELGLAYVDQEILVEAARQLGVSVAAVAQHDERARSVGDRLVATLRTLMERSAVATDPMSGAGLDVVLAHTYGEAAQLPEDEGQALNLKRYISTLTSVIKSIAARGDVVILGRGSQAILRDEPGAFHAWIVAPKEQRVRGLVEREGMKPDDALKRIKDSDSSRAAFHQRFFKIDAESAQLYDLTVNLARIDTSLAVALIARAVRERIDTVTADVSQS